MSPQHDVLLGQAPRQGEQPIQLAAGTQRIQAPKPGDDLPFDPTGHTLALHQQQVGAIGVGPRANEQVPTVSLR